MWISDSTVLDAQAFVQIGYGKELKLVLFLYSLAWTWTWFLGPPETSRFIISSLSSVPNVAEYLTLKFDSRRSPSFRLFGFRPWTFHLCKIARVETCWLAVEIVRYFFLTRVEPYLVFLISKSWISSITTLSQLLKQNRATSIFSTPCCLTLSSVLRADN